MKLVKISDYFDVKYGVNLELNKLEICKNGINFVSRTSKNNGVSAKVKLIDISSNPAGSISVSGGGSVLEAFLQDGDYYSGRDLYYLTPKIELSKNEKLYYCLCIRANKYRYNYGRQANKTLKDIQIPHKDEIPDYVYQYDLTKYDKMLKDAKKAKPLKLDEKSWKEFRVGELFEIEKGERLVKSKRVDGNTPFLTATSLNNGVSNLLDFESFESHKKIFENKITVDMFCNVFYHNYKYFSDDNVHTLVFKDKFKKFNNSLVCLFIVVVLKKLSLKYTYGRQVRLSRLPDEIIKLPVNSDRIDWNFMENYIKNLPLGKEI